MLDYTRKGVLELKAYHTAKRIEAVAAEKWSEQCYHEGALATLAAMVGCLFDLEDNE